MHLVPPLSKDLKHGEQSGLSLLFLSAIICVQAN